MADGYIYWTSGQCDTQQAMTEATYKVLKASSQTFYCVHGHKRHYPQGESREERLQKQLDEERRIRQRAEQMQSMWRDDAEAARKEADHQRNRANGYKGHATRITKRAKAGVCPCCNRHFVALERHMATKHPDFTPLEAENA